MADTVYTSPFIDAGIAAFSQWFQLEWTKYVSDENKRLHTAVVGNVTDLRKANDQLKVQALPTFLMSPARMELNADRGGGAARFRKFTTAVDRARGTAIIRTLAPVRFGMMCQFRTDDATHVKFLSEMILNNYPGPSFFFEDNTGFRVECRVYLDSGIDWPQSNIADAGDLYVVDGLVISMTTYIGTAKEQGLIREIRVRYVEGTGSIVSTLSVDKETGLVKELEDQRLTYTDPFDKKSSRYRSDLL